MTLRDLIAALFGWGRLPPASRSAPVRRGPARQRPTVAVPEDGPVYLSQSRDYDFDIVGESNYQEAIRKAAGGYGAWTERVVLLVPEPDNRHDGNAVRVECDGEALGYLPAEKAAAYLKRLEQLGARGRTATCAAYLVNYSKKSGKMSSVRLGITWPVRLRATPNAV